MHRLAANEQQQAREGPQLPHAHARFEALNLSSAKLPVILLNLQKITVFLLYVVY